MKGIFFTIYKIFFIFLFFISTFSDAKEWVGILTPQPSLSEKNILSSDINNSVIQLSVSGFYKNEVLTDRGKAFFITANNSTQLLKTGAPDLPKFTASLIIPDNGIMQAEVTSALFQDFANIEIAPSKGNLLRTVLPSEVAYQYGTQYLNNQFYPSEIVELRSPYILRDMRGQTVVINPFQYNPVTKVLRVYYTVTVRVFNIAAVDETNKNPSSVIKEVDQEFASVYQHHFINSSSAQYLPVNENGSLLVICPSQWSGILQPLVSWKIQKGIPTDMVDVITAGGTAENIRDFIVDYYNTHNLTHILLVGDDAQVPTLTASGGASDASYGFILGSDSYAEVFVGRFVAQTSADVQTQVDRTLNYEKFPDTTGSWYNRGVVVASNQGPGDDAEMDWEHAVNIRTDLLAYTYTDVAELYDGTHPGTSDSTGNPNNIDLFDELQNGVSLMSYTGHGSTTSFGTTGFSNSDVLLLTNTNQLPIIWSVGCVNGDFKQAIGPCLGEEFLNAQYNGQPTGAIATMMSSINQSWNPPMDAQDEMVDILVESYANNIKRTFGGISVNGCMHMNDEYGLAGYAMTDTWICFGDPTLNVRTATPIQITVSHDDTLTVGVSNLMVNCNQDGALVALTLNGAIISTGTITSGTVQLNFQTINIVDTITITVTGFNLIPYIATVLVVPSNGAYVVYQADSSYDVTGNSNGIIEYDEMINVNITLQNLGLADANNLTINLSSNDQYINIINSNASLNNVFANSNNSVLNAFSYLLAANIPDQHTIQFLITVTDSLGNSWVSSFVQLVNAPSLFIGGLTINDTLGGNGNGYLEPGETADLVIECFNVGHSDAQFGFASLSSSNPFLSLNTAAANLIALAPQTSSTVSFNVALSSSMMYGTAYDFTCQLSAGLYITNKLFYRTAGENLEDFETNNFNKYAWGMMGNQNWFTTNASPFQGTYCAQSGNINDGETSGLRLGVNLMMDDSISFWYQVSSEQDWDFLTYKINNVKIDQWSGILPWTYAAYPINAGSHLIMFSYEKDGAISTGSDCAWLDNIKLPPGTVVTSINDHLADSNGIICYPNPVSSIINIAISKSEHTLTLIQLLDMNGKVLRTINYNDESVTDIIRFPVAPFKAGIYILRIENGIQTFYKKIVVE